MQELEILIKDIYARKHWQTNITYNKIKIKFENKTVKVTCFQHRVKMLKNVQVISQCIEGCRGKWMQWMLPISGNKLKELLC